MNTRRVLKELRGLRRAAQDQAQAAQDQAQHCDRLIEDLESGPQNDTDMIDQHASALGSRRHCEAVRRRRSEGKLDAFKFGRRHVLTAEAYAEELTWAGRSDAQLARCGARPAAEAEAEEEVAYRALLKRMGN